MKRIAHVTLPILAEEQGLTEEELGWRLRMVRSYNLIARK